MPLATHLTHEEERAARAGRSVTAGFGLLAAGFFFAFSAAEEVAARDDGAALDSWLR